MHWLCFSHRQQLSPTQPLTESELYNWGNLIIKKNPSKPKYEKPQKKFKEENAQNQDRQAMQKNPDCHSLMPKQSLNIGSHRWPSSWPVSLWSMMPWGVPLVSWVSCPGSVPLPTLCASPASSLVGWGAEKAVALCKCCSVVSKASLCYQHWSQHKSKTQPHPSCCAED